jgi:hypothetical protein
MFEVLQVFAMVAFPVALVVGAFGLTVSILSAIIAERVRIRLRRRVGSPEWRKLGGTTRDYR